MTSIIIHYIYIFNYYYVNVVKIPYRIHFVMFILSKALWTPQFEAPCFKVKENKERDRGYVCGVTHWWRDCSGSANSPGDWGGKDVWLVATM